MVDLVVAHADDEVVFGWPVLAQAERIICVSLPRGRRSAAALADIGRLVDADIFCLGLNPGFGDVALPELGETVWTHNAWGEYGHRDHQRVNRLVGPGALVNDICVNVEYETKGLKPVWQGETFDDCTIDEDLFAEAKAIYERHDAWTWSRGTPATTRLYVSEHEQRSYTGTVRAGRGDTSRQLPAYHDQLTGLIGFTPVDGSLNVWMRDPVPLRGEGIQMWTAEHGTYRFWPATFNGTPAAVVRPPGGWNRDRDAEIVAPSHLRTTFGLADGDRVEVVLRERGASTRPTS